MNGMYLSWVVWVGGWNFAPRMCIVGRKGEMHYAS